jgi:F-type H+-transporting ATPase subunit delta
MANKQLASRYAKALLELASERNELNKVFEDMTLFQQSCEGSSDLVVFLKSPVIKADDKIAVLNKIFSGKITDLSLAFLSKLARSTREAYLHEIATEFISHYKKHNNIITAHLTSAIPLSDSFKSAVSKLIVEIPNDGKSYTVEFTEKINKDLIGGFVLRVDDKQIDTSLSRRVGLLRRSFNENLYIKEF